MNNEIKYFEISDILKPLINYRLNINKQIIRVYRYKCFSKKNKELRFSVYENVCSDLSNYFKLKKIPYFYYKEKKGTMNKKEYHYYELILPDSFSNFNKNFNKSFNKKSKEEKHENI